MQSEAVREREGARERRRGGEIAFLQNRERARGVVTGVTEGLMHGTQTGREGKAGLLFHGFNNGWDQVRGLYTSTPHE